MAGTHTTLTIEEAVGQMMLAAFEGEEMPVEFGALLSRRPIGGVTLFRDTNVRSPAQVRELTTALQKAVAASGQPPLLIGADQEGGTLVAMAGTTPFPGNMALGATRSEDLAGKVGRAMGIELAAMGINVNYAPVCDVNINPHNPVIGPRSFGENPALVAKLAAALVEGLQEEGVAATAKHFPGHGDTSGDSHHALPVLPFKKARLRSVELPPFAAAIDAGVRLVMTAHIALPALNDGLPVPSTLSRPVLRGLLRHDLGFKGVIVTDALNMGAISQGQGLLVDAIAACHAGADLLMLADSGCILESVYAAVLQAAQRGLLAQHELISAANRIVELKEWIGSKSAGQPGLERVACEEHQALAFKVAADATTLVRDRDCSLPLRLSQQERLLTIVPRPRNLTPADTSSYDKPALGGALRRYHEQVDEITVPLDPSVEEIAVVVAHSKEYDLVVVGTINATEHRGQAEIVRELVSAGVHVIAVALRLPYDLQVYPEAPVYVCTYSLQPTSLDALAGALWGQLPFRGQLPVTVAGA